MTERDPIAEWRRALAKREPSFRPLSADAVAGAAAAFVAPPAFDTRATDLRSTRAITGDDLRMRMDWRGDLGTAIRTLQRHNKRLVSAFGITWVDATNIVIGESRRRALPAATVARGIASGLPRTGGDAS